MMGLIRKIDNAVLKVEALVLVVTIGLMTLMAFGDVMSKLIADYPIQWVEMAVRYLVIWIAFVGGSVATAHGRHITIDIASRYLKTRGRAIAVALTSLAAIGILVVLLVVSISYLKMKVADQTIAFTIHVSGLNLPVKSYIALSIVPPALLAMAWHFLVLTIQAVVDPENLPSEDSEQPKQVEVGA